MTALLLAGCCSVAGGEYSAKLDNNGVALRHVTDLSLFSRFIVVEPPWGEKYFFTVWSPTAVERTELPDGAYRLTMTQSQPDDRFRLNEYSAEVHDDRVIVRLDGELLQDIPATTEYSMMMVPELLSRDAAYAGRKADGTAVAGRIDPNWKNWADTLATELVELKLTSPLGTLTVTVDRGMSFNLVDRRGFGFDVGTATSTPGLWIGNELPIQYAKPIQQQLTVTFQLADEVCLAEPLPRLANQAAATAEPAVLLPYRSELPLLPQPHQQQNTGKPYRPAAGDALYLAATGLEPAAYDKLSRAAQRILNDEMQLHLQVASNASSGGITIQITDTPVDGLTAPEQAEGYALRVEPDGVLIVSRSDRGAFYALQTLRQRYDGAGFAGGEIVDYPDLDWRGVLIMVDEHSPEVHGELIRKVLAPMKYNQLYIECEFAAWDATEAVRQPWAISKDELRKLIALAEDNYLEVIPLFQTLGHCEWLFKNGRNLEMAENPADPYAYNPSHPGVYPLMTAALDEVLEVFNRPKYLHIGHDEVGQEYSYPTRPENIAKGGAQVILDDVMFYYDYCRKNNLRMMMWQDMFAASTNSRDGAGDNGYFGLGDRRDELPRDIIFAFWNYGTNINENNLRKLRQEGFDVVGCTWFEPDNIAMLTSMCRDAGALGMMMTTWAGYHGFDRLLEDNFQQVAAYVLQGTWAWNCSAEANRFSPGRVLDEILYPDAGNAAASGITFDLSEVANLDLSAGNQPFLLDPLLGFDRLPERDFSHCDVKFRLPERDGRPLAVALQSRCNPKFPDRVDGIQLNCRASQLFFLHSCRDLGREIAPGAVIAEYVIHYSDGSEAVMPVRYRQEIALPHEDHSRALPFRHCVDWRDDDGGTVNLWYATWRNPHPEKQIVSLDVRAVPERYPFYLFALSAAE